MRSLTSFFIAGLLLLSSCGEVDKFTMFDIDYTTSVTVPSSTGVNLPVDLTTPEVSTNSQSEFEVNDTRKDLVEEITITEITLTITSPTGGDFSFLNSIEIYISATDLPEKKIAWKENIASDVGNTLTLDNTPDDLKEYIKKDAFSLRITTVTDEVIDEDHTIEVYSLFHVDAKILGI